MTRNMLPIDVSRRSIGQQPSTLDTATGDRAVTHAIGRQLDRFVGLIGPRQTHVDSHHTCTTVLSVLGCSPGTPTEVAGAVITEVGGMRIGRAG